jgi:hypothetical protein
LVISIFVSGFLSVFGFVAKEIVVGALAVIYGLQGDALMTQMATQIDWVQAMSFMLFTTTNLLIPVGINTFVCITISPRTSRIFVLSILSIPSQLTVSDVVYPRHSVARKTFTNRCLVKSGAMTHMSSL